MKCRQIYTAELPLVLRPLDHGDTDLKVNLNFLSLQTNLTTIELSTAIEVLRTM